MEGPQYTTILYRVKKKLKLTANEYLIADSIDKLSNNAKFQWCEVNREDIANFQGISRRSVISIIQKLKDKGLVEVNENTRGLRTTKKWIENVVLERGVKFARRVKKLHTKGEESSPSQSEETSLPSYNNRNSDNSNIEIKISNQVALIRDYFIERCKELKGFEPEMAFGKEGRLLKDKLKRYSAEQLKDLIDKFFKSRIGEELGFTLSICLSAGVINQWLGGKLEKPKKPTYNGNPMRKMFNKWQVLDGGDWKEFADSDKKIIYI